MNKILITALFLIGFALNTNAQVYQKDAAFGREYKRVKSDSTLLIPTFCGVPTLRSSTVSNQSAIAYDSCNKRFYFYNPSLAVWDTIVGGGSTIDTTSLSDRINLKFNTSDTTNKWVQDAGSNGAGDSLIVVKNGVRSAWKYPSGGWGLTGNTGTDPATNFIGTTDNQPLVFKTNNLRSGIIEYSNTSSWNLGLAGGLNAPSRTGTGNIALGSFSMGKLTTGTNNISIGQATGNRITSGSSNIALGIGAIGVISDVTGSGNIGIGSSSLTRVTSGDFNTAIGPYSMYKITSSSYNIGVGYQAGENVTSGATKNLMLGNRVVPLDLAGANTLTGSSNIIIGDSIQPASWTSSNQLNIQNLIYGTGLDGRLQAISTGNIGIGVKAPAQKLDVAGNIKLTGLVFQNTDTLSTMAYARSLGGGGGSMVYPGAGIPLSTGSAWGTSITDNSTNWNTAYSWGNHAGLYRPIGYVPTFAELLSKPTTLSGYGITDAYPLTGNPSGFLTSYSETDPTAVKLTGNQTVAGIKTFTDPITYSDGVGGIKLQAFSGYRGIWFDKETPDLSNYSLLLDNSTWQVNLNALGGVQLRVGNDYTDQISYNSSKNFVIGEAAGTTGLARLHVKGDVYLSGIIKTPSSAGTALQVPRINAAGTAMEYYTPSAGVTAQQISDSIAANTVKIVPISPLYKDLDSLKIKTASDTETGVITPAMKTLWDAKQAPITLTTTGSSGAATFIGGVLNIPNYAGGGGTGDMLKSENLSGLADYSIARTNLGLATVAATGSFASLLSKPTTLSGYGIIDAVNTTTNQTIAGVKTFNDIPIMYGVKSTGNNILAAGLGSQSSMTVGTRYGVGLSIGGVSGVTYGLNFGVNVANGESWLQSANWVSGGVYNFNVQAAGGNFGVGKIYPTEKLDIDGNVRFSGALMPNNLPGTSGQVLTSAGAGLAPTWQTPTGVGTPVVAKFPLVKTTGGGTDTIKVNSSSAALSYSGSDVTWDYATNVNKTLVVANVVTNLAITNDFDGAVGVLLVTNSSGGVTEFNPPSDLTGNFDLPNTFPSAIYDGEKYLFTYIRIGSIRYWNSSKRN